MKKVFLICASAMPLLTSCATYDYDDKVIFSTGSTAFWCFIIIGLSTPKLYLIISHLSSKGDEQLEEEIKNDIGGLLNGMARKDLPSYQKANYALMLSFCVPICSWILILYGAGAIWGNGLGLIFGAIAAWILSNRYFFNHSLTIIMRLVLLAIAIICLCIGM